MSASSFNPSYLHDCFDKVTLNDKESFSFIFYDNFDFLHHLFSTGSMRASTLDDIQKTILCGSVFLGYNYFFCPHCDKDTIIPYTCKSRLCTKCGVKAAKERAAFVSSMALDSQHRHLVFTIAEPLRHFFLKDRSLLDILFIAARNTLINVFNDKAFRKLKRKFKKKFLPSQSQYLFKDIKHPILFGAVASLHSFGRDLKHNPHIHVLLSEDAYDSKNDTIKNFSFLPYEKLRKTWMYEVLSLLQNRLPEYFKYLKNELYRVHPDGFYVHGPKQKKETTEEDIDTCVSYMTRYTSRPAMAESRILTYDPETKQIHWFYHDHKTEERVDVKEHVHNFLKKLLQHCPDAHFKMVRYYGFYSNKSRKTLERMYELQGKKKKKEIRTWKQRQEVIQLKKIHLRFRFHMVETLHIDPLLCSCGHFMEFLYSYIPKGGEPIQRKHRDKWIQEIEKNDSFNRRRDPRIMWT